MRVISCEKPKTFKEKTENIPTIKQGEVLVKVKRIGICGTDIHAYNGNQPFFTYPRVLGHELSGEIHEINPGESKLNVGDTVTILPYLECGKCIACRRGKTNCCTDMKVLGVHLDGGMSEYISVPTDHVFVVNKINYDEAAMVEPLSIGAHAVRRSNLSNDQVALVIGAGPIGLGVMKFAKLTGAKVIAMDINNDRLEFCKEWAGVDQTINALNDPLAEVANVTNGDLPTVVFDATGNKNSMTNAFQFVSHGGQLIYVGLVKDDITFYDPEFHKRELTLFASRNATKEDFRYVITSIEQGLVNIDAIITHRSSLNNLIDEFESFYNPNNKVIKAIVEL